MALAVALILGVPSAAQAGVVLPCGSVITQDTRLGADMLNCPGDAIEIGADVTLDLGGHTISGTGSGAGVFIPKGRTATVKAGVITDFAAGIESDRSRTITLRDLQISSNGTGVGAPFAGTLNMYKSRVMYNDGVGVFGTWGTYTGNEFSHNYGLAGLRLNYSGGGQFKNNEFSDNAGYGAYITDATSSFINNVASRNGRGGIVAEDQTPLESFSRYYFADNTTNANDGLGLSFATAYTGAIGYVDGGDNRARRNSDPRQCVGVVCR